MTDHAETCEVTKQRAALDRDLEADPTNEYLLGARVEYYDGGDQEVELCDCGAVPSYDEEREDYANLADEMNDPEAGPWNEDDWDDRAVANARSYAQKHDLPWPPRMGDFDRWYERGSQ